MARNKIIIENEDYTNRSVAKLLFYCSFLCILVIILAYTPIIQTNKLVTWRDFGISALLLFVPYLFYYILKLTGPWFKYLGVASIILVLFVLYSDFEINRFVFILWIVPILISIFYFDRNFSIIISLTVMLSINVIDLFINHTTIFTPIIFKDGRNTVAIENPLIIPDTIFIDICFIALIICSVALSIRTRKLLTDLVTTEEQKSILQRLALLMQEANRVSAVLVKSAKRLSEISSESKKASEKNAEYTQALTSGAKSSLELIHNSNPIYIQMADRIREIAQNTTELNAIANKLNEVTMEGSRAIAHATDQMQKIAAASKESKDIMDQLNTMSKRIVQIIKTISSIARQTNLLALNASIEASRAGEGGEGFRVVASSIRDLATQSAKATEDIRDLVAGIQNEIALAVKSIENEAGLAESGLKIINQAGEAFTEISATQEKLTGQATQISAATQEIASNSSLVTTSANEIEQFARNGLNNAENIAAATVQQLASAQELLAQAENVYQIAEKLNKLGKWSGERKNIRKT